MRRVLQILLILSAALLLSTCASAFQLFNTETPGKNPSVYGSIIAFETHEDYAGKDLNDDGDMGDNVIQFYDTDKQTVTSTKTTGHNPSVFANNIVFETLESEEHKDLNDDGDKEDSIIQYYSLHDEKTINTGLEGRDFYLYQYLIVFSTPEKSMGIDYNNDGDTDDNIIRSYDILKNELANTKQVGRYPSTNGRRIFMSTSEQEAKTDINNDGDTDDELFQVFSIEAKTAVPTDLPGTLSTMNKQGIAAYLQDKKLKTYDAEGGIFKDTGMTADSCRAKETAVVCDEDSKIKTYNLGTKTSALVDIRGAKADLFENTIAFQTEEEYAGDLNNDGDQKDTIIRYAIVEDEDSDGWTEIMDNCPVNANPAQADMDNDGIGDECDAVDDRPKEVKQAEAGAAEQETAQTGQTQSSAANENKDKAESENESNWEMWFGIILAVLIILVGAALYIPGYYRRKKKGFGF